MLDILTKFELKIQMMAGDFEELNKLELRKGIYSKTVDYDFKKLIDLTSEDILELFDLVIVIEPDRGMSPPCLEDNVDYKKRSKFLLKDGDKYVSTYYHQVIVIPDTNRIINNTPEKDPYSVISIAYL